MPKRASPKIKGVFKSKWDLSKIYSGVDDAKLFSEIDALEKESSLFSKKYGGGKVKKLDVGEILKFITNAEELISKSSYIGAYCEISSMVNDCNNCVGDKIISLEQKLCGLTSPNQLLFEELLRFDATELTKLSKDLSLSKYKYFLDLCLEAKKHSCSRKENMFLNKRGYPLDTEITSLYNKIKDSISFEFRKGNRRMKLSEIELFKFFNSGDARVKRRVIDTYIREYSRKDVFNSLSGLYSLFIREHVSNAKAESFSCYLDHVAFMAEISPEKLKEVFYKREEFLALSQRYHSALASVKRERYIDQYNLPILDRGERMNFGFKRSCNLFLEFMENFNPKKVDFFRELFEGGYVDFYPRKGKREGAFCVNLGRDLHYVLVNSDGGVADFFELTHELGHVYHNHISSNNSCLLDGSSTILSEVPSILNEFLLEDFLISRLPEKYKETIKLHVLDETISNIFHQGAFLNFEKEVYERSFEDKRVLGEEYNLLWRKELEKFYGPAYKFHSSANKEVSWLNYPHLFNYPFYSINYLVGACVALNLFDLYKKDKKGFVPVFEEMLLREGGENPVDILKIAGINFNSRDFFDKSFVSLERRVEKFEKLVYKK